jgi:hypothetical protein
MIETGNNTHQHRIFSIPESSQQADGGGKPPLALVGARPPKPHILGSGALPKASPRAWRGRWRAFRVGPRRRGPESDSRARAGPPPEPSVGSDLDLDLRLRPRPSNLDLRQGSSNYAVDGLEFCRRLRLR